MPYYVALPKGINPKTLGLAKQGDKAYLQCFDSCEITGGETVTFEIEIRK